ncbi:MAG: hypothetical protein ACK4K9_02270 [Bacteroidia bacterium]
MNQVSLAQQALIISKPDICKQKIQNLKPVFQLLNNKMNVSVNLCNGILFQLNEIDFDMAKCGSQKKVKNYKEILIKENEAKTYTKTKYCNGSLKISCKNNILQIEYKGKITAADKSKISIEATISELISTIKESKIYYE